MIQLSHIDDDADSPATPGASYRCNRDQPARPARQRTQAGCDRTSDERKRDE